jgi:predicted ester cyclase
MSTQETNKKIVTDFVNELTNNHNPEAWSMYCSEDFAHHFNLPDVPPNLQGIKMLSTGILAAFPDVSVTIDLLIADNDFVIERATAKATHSGTYNHIQPTGKSYEWYETHIYRLKNGKIVEHFPEVRLEKLLSQLGGKGDGFVAPAKSLLSSFIALMMGGLAKLYKNSNPQHVPVVENNKSVVSRYVNEFKNEQKFTVFPKLFSSEFTHHFNFPDRTNGMDSFVSVGQMFLAAFPDVRVDLQQMLAEGDLVVEQNKVSGTHKGTFDGIEATNRKVYWTETHIYRLEDGKIIENWPAVNFERIVMQIK